MPVAQSKRAWRAFFLPLSIKVLCISAYLDCTLRWPVQGQFLLGRQGPAQCLNMTDAPMNIHLVPRNGDKPMVSSLSLTNIRI